MSRSDNKERSYSYSYDALDRLRKAYYFKEHTYTKSYDETMDYDKNGNIQNMERFGDLDNPGVAIQIDDLKYEYIGNRLNKVTDNSLHPAGFKDGANMGGEYDYDGNGNMVADGNKRINHITYNHMDLPIEINFMVGEKITYLYDASGNKLKKTVLTTASTTVTDYLSGFQYIDEKLDLFPTAEGYVKCHPETESRPARYNYAFNIKDHLGNIRVSYGLDPKEGHVVILEENHFYPFGLKHEKYNSDKFEYVADHKDDTPYPTGIEPLGPQERRSYQYKYNGKEWQDELGLNFYDYGARNYDPALGRWMNIDPKAEFLESSSPYVYALNCPIIYLDKDGELPIFINGKVSADSERGDASYWSTEIIATITGSGIPNPGGQIHYVDGDRWRSPYSRKILNSHWNQGGVNNAYYRKDAGYNSMTASEFKSILSKLERNAQGKIIEKIQIYTHSRGAAFGAGYTECLLELIKENAAEFADADNVVDFMFNMAPHQSNDITAPKGGDSYSLDRTKDPLSGDDMSGVKGAFKTDEGGYKKAHSITTFGKDLKAFTSSFLKGGASKDVISNFIKKMKDEYNITVTVK